MPTGRSSADVGRHPGPATSLALLLGLRARGLRTPARVAVVVGVALLVAVTVVSVTFPSQVGLAPELVEAMRRYLPVGFLAFVVTTATAVLFGGGGREAIAADQVVAYPLGPTTDHLAGLVLAPLNLAWLLQAWSLLAAVGGAHPGRPHLGRRRARPALAGGGDRHRPVAVVGRGVRAPWAARAS